MNKTIVCKDQVTTNQLTIPLNKLPHGDGGGLLQVIECKSSQQTPK